MMKEHSDHESDSSTNDWDPKAPATDSGHDEVHYCNIVRYEGLAPLNFNI